MRKYWILFSIVSLFMALLFTTPASAETCDGNCHIAPVFQALSPTVVGNGVVLCPELITTVVAGNVDYIKSATVLPLSATAKLFIITYGNKKIRVKPGIKGFMFPTYRTGKII